MKTELTLVNELDKLGFETLKNEEMNTIEGGAEVIVIYRDGRLIVTYR